MQRVKIIGAGLAGSEAAWQIARLGIPVELIEMRPEVMSPAHKTGDMAELVCSNSLGSEDLNTGAGLLKAELELYDSLILKIAQNNRVPAGRALAVDREIFAKKITEEISAHPLISLRRGEVNSVCQKGISIVATGPLTSTKLAENIFSYTGEENLFFFDAAAPLIEADSIDEDKTFRGSRYDCGDDYINCPMTEEQYKVFWENLIKAETVPLRDFETDKLFQGCLPVEYLAKKGYQTLVFGPMKPVGLASSQGKRPFAVVQLRQDNVAGSLYNMVGFQTRLKWDEQRRVFRLIPGLEKAVFLRLGVMHRNIFINSPQLLRPTLQFKKNEKLLFAGQITGVEGYLESTLSGLWAGINAARLITGYEPLIPPVTTPSGALFNYICNCKTDFQPISFNYGLLPQPENGKKSKKIRRQEKRERALTAMVDFREIFCKK